MHNHIPGGPKPLIVDGAPVMFRGRPVYEIVGASETRTSPEDIEKFIFKDLEELKGRTPDELKDMLQMAEAHIRSLHQDESTGELRELSDAERTAMDMAIEIRGKIIDR